MLQDILTINFPGRLEQPGQSRGLLTLRYQQTVQRSFMPRFKLRGQRRKNCPVCKRCCFGQSSLDDINRRENDLMIVESGEHFFRQQKTFVCPHGVRIKVANAVFLQDPVERR